MQSYHYVGMGEDRKTTGDLARDGFTLIPFSDSATLRAIQDIALRTCPGIPNSWPPTDLTDEERVNAVDELSRAIGSSGLLTQLVQSEANSLIHYLGPDIDIQAVPHVRVSRPRRESDIVHWHRDYFYGNTPWELNLWFPLFPISEGAGLEIVPGSHVEPSRGIRAYDDPNPFRRSVLKGSAANRIGYLYAPKIDDTISRLDPSTVTLLTPKLGEGILFFGTCIHRGINHSSSCRVSIDIRLRHHRAPTSTKPGYYVQALRGPIEQCASRFLAVSAPSLSIIVPCLNEDENLENTITTLLSALDGVLEDYEILIMNDGSTDRTPEIADALAQRWPRVQACHHPRNLGLGACFYGGIARATKEHVMMVFGDNEIDPSSLRGLFSSIGKADMVIPYLTNARIRPWHRQIISIVFTFLVNFIGGRKIRYYNGPVIHRRRLLIDLGTRSQGFAYMAEIVTKLLARGATYLEVPYWMQRRPHGSPKAFRLKNIMSVAVTLAAMLKRRLAGEAA